MATFDLAFYLAVCLKARKLIEFCLFYLLRTLLVFSLFFHVIFSDRIASVCYWLSFQNIWFLRMTLISINYVQVNISQISIKRQYLQAISNFWHHNLQQYTNLIQSIKLKQQINNICILFLFILWSTIHYFFHFFWLFGIIFRNKQVTIQSSNLQKKYYHISIIEKQSSQKMNVRKCDCPVQGYFTLFCIQDGCKLPRRLCGNCKKEHHGHQIIQYDDQSSFDIFNINQNNPNRQHIIGILSRAFSLSEFTKEKIINDIKTLETDVSECFNFFIQKPLRTLIGTNTDDFAIEKRLKTQDSSTTKQQLSQIAQQLRILNNPLFSKIQWLKTMSQAINQQIRQFRLQLEQNITLIKKQLKRLQQFSPYDKNLSATLSQIKKNRQDQQVEEMIQKQRMLRQKKQQETKEMLRQIEEYSKRQENSRQNFINKFQTVNVGKNQYAQQHQYAQYAVQKLHIIGWKNSWQSLNLWKAQGKTLAQIQDLTIPQGNLMSIPNQINLFYRLRRLDIGGNQIRKIQNLDNLLELTILYLGVNKIQKIQGLENLTQLRQLSLYGNQINIVQNLEHLINLVQLNLDANPLQKTTNAVNLINRLIKNGIRIQYSWA